MIYLIDGNEIALIERKVKEIANGSDNVYRFNGADSGFDIMDVLNACNSSSLFSEKNVVLFINPSFLIKKENGDLDKFIEYINNPKYETDLVIYTIENNFNKTLKAYKTICKNAECLNYSQLDQNNFKSAARSIIIDSKIDITNDAIEKLISYSGNSQTNLLSNLEILKNYPEKIDSNCIEKLCSKEINEDIFALIDSIARNNISSTKKILNSLYEHNNSVFMIIAVLASQLRFMYQVCYYSSIGYTSNDIANVTNSKPFRIQKTLEKIGNLDCNRIIELLDELSNIDLLNKSDSSLSQNERFEIYLVKNFRRTR